MEVFPKTENIPNVTVDEVKEAYDYLEENPFEWSGITHDEIINIIEYYISFGTESIEEDLCINRDTIDIIIIDFDHRLYYRIMGNRYFKKKGHPIH